MTNFNHNIERFNFKIRERLYILGVIPFNKSITTDMVLPKYIFHKTRIFLIHLIIYTTNDVINIFKIFLTDETVQTTNTVEIHTGSYKILKLNTAYYCVEFSLYFIKILIHIEVAVGSMETTNLEKRMLNHFYEFIR